MTSEQYAGQLRQTFALQSLTGPRRTSADGLVDFAGRVPHNAAFDVPDGEIGGVTRARLSAVLTVSPASMRTP